MAGSPVDEAVSASESVASPISNRRFPLRFGHVHSFLSAADHVSSSLQPPAPLSRPHQLVRFSRHAAQATTRLLTIFLPESTHFNDGPKSFPQPIHALAQFSVLFLLFAILALAGVKKVIGSELALAECRESEVGRVHPYFFGGPYARASSSLSIKFRWASIDSSFGCLCIYQSYSDLMTRRKDAVRSEGQ